MFCHCKPERQLFLHPAIIGLWKLSDSKTSKSKDCFPHNHSHPALVVLLTQARWIFLHPNILDQIIHSLWYHEGGNASRDKRRPVGHPRTNMVCYVLEDTRSRTYASLASDKWSLLL